MKYSLFFTFVFATCHASNIGLGGLFPRSNDPVVDSQDTVVENPDLEPTTTVTNDLSTTTMDFPPSQTTTDAEGTIIYYCIPSPGDSAPAQETWQAKTTVTDNKTIYYCPPKTTDVVIKEVSSTIYYSLPEPTPPAIREIPTTIYYTAPEPIPTVKDIPSTSIHVCEVTSVIGVKSASTCETSIETLRMDVFKTIYVSSCVVTEDVVIIEEISTTTTESTTTTTTTVPIYVLPTY